MVDAQRREELETLFYAHGEPGDLNDEEWAYWETLKAQWNRTVENVYRRISEADRRQGRDKQWDM